MTPAIGTSVPLCVALYPCPHNTLPPPLSTKPVFLSLYHLATFVMWLVYILSLQAFLNQKYGRVVAPCRILASAFERLLKKVVDSKDKELLSRCYRLDENAVPSVYILEGSTTTEPERENICNILRNSWSKEEKELYLASGKTSLSRSICDASFFFLKQPNKLMTDFHIMFCHPRPHS